MKKNYTSYYFEEIENLEYSYSAEKSETSYYYESIRYAYTSASIGERSAFDESCFYLNAKLFA